MKRTICAAAVLALFLGPNAMAGGPWLKSVAAAQKAAGEKKQFIFVDLWAEWCGWCHKFEQEVAPSEAFQKATDNMVLLRLNTEDGAEGSQFSQRYQATRLPMFLLLNPDLTIAGVIKGYAPASQFADMINQGIIGYRTFESTVQKEGMLARDYPRRLDIAKQFRERQNYTAAEPRLKKLTTEKDVPAAFRDQAYLELTTLYLDQGKYPEVMNSVASFRKVQKEGEAFERASLLVGEVYLRQGNFKAAGDEFRAFKKRFPASQMIPAVDSILGQLPQ